MDSTVCFSTSTKEDLGFVKKLKAIKGLIGKQVTVFRSTLSSEIVKGEEDFKDLSVLLLSRCHELKSCKFSIVDNNGHILPSLKVEIETKKVNGKIKTKYEGIFLSTLIEDSGCLSVLCSTLSGPDKSPLIVGKINSAIEQTLGCLIVPFNVDSDNLFWHLGLCLNVVSNSDLEEGLELDFYVDNRGEISLAFEVEDITNLWNGVHQSLTNTITRSEIFDLKDFLLKYVLEVYEFDISKFKFVGFGMETCSLSNRNYVNICCKQAELLFNLIAFFESFSKL